MDKRIPAKGSAVQTCNSVPISRMPCVAVPAARDEPAKKRLLSKKNRKHLKIFNKHSPEFLTRQPATQKNKPREPVPLA